MSDHYTTLGVDRYGVLLSTEQLNEVAINA